MGVSVGALVFNDNGEIFLSKRSQNCKNERGHWGAPGGGVEFGESLEQAVKREVQEEHGADIEIIQQFLATDHFVPAERQHWVVTTFLARFRPGHTPKIMEPDKCDAIGWFSLDELPTPLTITTKSDLNSYHRRSNAKG